MKRLIDFTVVMKAPMNNRRSFFFSTSLLKLLISSINSFVIQSSRATFFGMAPCS